MALRADTGTRSMESRIWREKIMLLLIYHVSRLEDGDLAKDMLEEQVSNSWSGLAKEVDQLVEMLKVEDPKTTQCRRKVYNEVVKTGAGGEKMGLCDDARAAQTEQSCSKQIVVVKII